MATGLRVALWAEAHPDPAWRCGRACTQRSPRRSATSRRSSGATCSQHVRSSLGLGESSTSGCPSRTSVQSLTVSRWHIQRPGLSPPPHLLQPTDCDHTRRWRGTKKGQRGASAGAAAFTWVPRDSQSAGDGEHGHLGSGLSLFKHRGEGLLAPRPADGLPLKLKAEAGRLPFAAFC